MAQSETTIESEFYSPWPLFGRHLSNQWAESRSNAESLHPIVRAVGLDSSFTLTKNAAVQSMEIGEQDFHNKYRSFWDKDNDSFRIQANTGTSAVPIWDDRIVISNTGQISGDFYPVTSLSVEEFSHLPGNLVFPNIERLFVSKTDGFYLRAHPDFSDQPILHLKDEIKRKSLFIQDTSEIANNIYNTTRLRFNRDDFYLTPNSEGDPVVNITSRGSGSGGGLSSIVVGDGVAPTFSTDTITFNFNEFYLTPDSSGKPIVNLGTIPGTEITFVSGSNTFSNEKLNFNPSTFYLTGTSDGSPQVNLENVILQDTTVPFQGTDGNTLQEVKSTVDLASDLSKLIGFKFNDKSEDIFWMFVSGSATAGLENTKNFHIYEPGTLTVPGSNANRFLIIGPGQGKVGFGASSIPSPVNNQLALLPDGKIIMGTTSLVHTDYQYKLTAGGSVSATSFYITDNQGSPTGAKELRPVTFTTTDLNGSFTPTEYERHRLKFNRSDFYITPDSGGYPIVNLAGSAPISRILLKQATSQTFNNLSEAEVENLTTTVYNVGGWTNNGTRITIPSGITAVRAIGQIEWDENATNSRIVKIYKNGASNIDGVIYENAIRPPATGGTFDNTAIQSAVSGIIPVSPGDTISFAGAQDSGGSVTSQATGSTWLYVEEVRASGSSGSNITLSDGSLPNYITNQINLNSSQFYLTSTSNGPMINLVDPLDEITVTDGINRQTDNVVNFSGTNFYISTNLEGQPVVNLISTSSGTALTVADEIDPEFTDVSKITFDDNFYIRGDSTGQPKVNFINKFSAMLINQNADQTVSHSSLTQLTFNETQYNVGEWGINLGTGDVTVPSGITHVKMTAQVRLNTIAADGRISLFFQRNGAQLSPSIAGNYHIVSGQAGGGQVISSYLVPVAQGDVLELWVFQVNTGILASSTDGSERTTWFGIEGYDFG